MSPGKIRRLDFFPDEFLAGVTDLRLDQVGAYWLVCSLIYSHGGPIPDDDRWIARVLGVDIRTWRPIKSVLLDRNKLRIIDGCLDNPRCERELAKARDRMDKAQKNGAAGGRPPHGQTGDQGGIGSRSTDDLPEISAGSATERQGDRCRSSSDPALISGSVSLENNNLRKADGFRRGKPNHQPSTTNQEETGERDGATRDASLGDGQEQQMDGSSATPDRLREGGGALCGSSRTGLAAAMPSPIDGDELGERWVELLAKADVGRGDAGRLFARLLADLTELDGSEAVALERLAERIARWRDGLAIAHVGDYDHADTRLAEIARAIADKRRAGEPVGDPVAYVDGAVANEQRAAPTNAEERTNAAPDSSAAERKRASSTRRPRDAPKNNLAELDAFEPSAEQLARLRAKAPAMADRLPLLAEEFRSDPWWRGQFEMGKYRDAARCFENFVFRQEGRALDRRRANGGDDGMTIAQRVAARERAERRREPPPSPF